MTHDENRDPLDVIRRAAAAQESRERARSLEEQARAEDPVMPCKFRLTATLKDPTMKVKKVFWSEMIGEFEEGEFNGELLGDRVSQAMDYA